MGGEEGREGSVHCAVWSGNIFRQGSAFCVHLTYACKILFCVVKVMSNELEEIMQEQVQQDDTWLQQYLSDLL